MTTNATAGPLVSGRPGTENLPLEQTVNHTDPTADPVTDARDRLRGMALSLATGSGPIVDPQSFAAAVDAYGDAVRAAVVAPPPSRAELRDRIAQALHAQMPGCAHDGHGADCAALADAVLAVLPEPTSRAAVLLDAADRMSRKAAKLTNGLDDLAIFVGKARAAEAEILNREADVLRRLAAEAQQQHGTETHAEEIGAALARYLVDRRLSEIQGAFRILGWPPLRFELVEDGEPASAVQQPAAADDEETPSRAVLLDLVRDFLDADPCSFDHHGYCQAHGWLGGEPGSCPHGRARKLIPGIDEDPIP